jgi:hypothetical protein
MTSRHASCSDASAIAAIYSEGVLERAAIETEPAFDFWSRSASEELAFMRNTVSSTECGEMWPPWKG